ncbi:MAG: anaerobic carbon-monoxide dehydrogenase catalytic subunit, partial [Synergistaceae bacterium]|jgi:carbon-monoxide dehydrogenase catalytic subunit|nr:anaerobic carbon-monoxide dehydrogenase catalytic subunit [Synergistaceae bacterium]
MSEYRTIDTVEREILASTEHLGISTQFDRYKAQQPQCKFGLTGVCCKICIQGPCRIIPSKKGADRGICGARDYTIVARNVARHIAGGASAHSDHGRDIAHTLLATAEGHAPDYRIRDSEKLHAVAKKVGVEVEGRRDVDIAKDVAILALNDFGKYTEAPCKWLETNIDDERRRKFKKTRINPPAIDRSIVQLLHETHMGTDADPVNIIFGGLQAALADFTGMSLSTDLSDILFGTPEPVKTSANLGVLRNEMVNIAIHGHNPVLSEMIVEMTDELQGEARENGAEGINLVGICCTGNEVLMRRGVPMATNFGSQELAIMTGALDAMVVDVQCIAPGIQEVSNCYHTLVISTVKFSKIPGAAHVEFDPAHARESATEIVRMAIKNFSNRRPDLLHIPSFKKNIIGGFSIEALNDILDKANPGNPMGVLSEAVRSGEIKGICAFAGCNNQKVEQDLSITTIARELAKNDVFLVSTGCSAGAFAKFGMMSPEGVDNFAGPGLKSLITRIQNASGLALPLVFHMGSCVDNSRIQQLWHNLALDMGVSVPELPFVATAPEATSEKAISIGAWMVAMGIPTHVGVMPPIEGSALV